MFVFIYVYILYLIVFDVIVMIKKNCCIFVFNILNFNYLLISWNVYFMVSIK